MSGEIGEIGRDGGVRLCVSQEQMAKRCRVLHTQEAAGGGRSVVIGKTVDARR